MFDERTDPQPSILTVAEVALYLRVSETTVWRWCSGGKLPAFRIGRSWRVRRHDLDHVIAGGAKASATSVPEAVPPAP